MHAAREPHLREKHGAELAGADQADGDGSAGGLAFEQQGVQIHGFLRVFAREGGRSYREQIMITQAGYRSRA